MNAGAKRSLIRFWPALLIVIAFGAVLQATSWGIAVAPADASSGAALDLTIAPPVLLADGSTHSIIYVQIVGADGAPRLATELTKISLVSSNPQVARVADFVTIESGQSYAIASVTTTIISGKAVISAVSGDFATAHAEVQTFSLLEDPMLTRLVLYASPKIMVLGGDPPGLLSIVLLDDNGQSLPAASDLTVELRSSDPDVVPVPDNILIAEGAHFATANLEPLAVGSAILSAVYPGYVSEFIEVSVVEPGDKAEGLLVYFSPPVVRARTGDQSTVVIQAVDNEGIPSYFPCTQVILASSSPLSVEVLPGKENTCDSRIQYSTRTLLAGQVPGVAMITAASSGMRPWLAALDVQGRMPAQLKAYLAPRQLLSLEATPGFIVLQVLDEDGLPLKDHGGISVTPVGTSGNFNDEWLIDDGRSFIAIKLSGPQIADPAELWFVNAELKSAHLELEGHALPTELKAQPFDGLITPGQETLIQVRAESQGLPLAQSQLNWHVTNGTLRNASLRTDENGEGSALFLATDLAEGLVEVTAEKMGYEPAATEVTVSVVAPIDPNKPGPKLLGIPVRYLFLTFVVALVGYVGPRVYRPLGRKLSAFRR